MKIEHVDESHRLKYKGITDFVNSEIDKEDLDEQIDVEESG